VFDHVVAAVSDFEASERFYRTVLSVLGVEPSHADAGVVEWEDWVIGPADREHPVTRGLHVGFSARDRAQVDAFWQAGVDAGYRDDGAPGPRTQYGPTYYGGFLLDPDGNSVEAVHAAALAAGYEDHGAPGERAVYHPRYYGAFVLDPDGHNVEVVNHNEG
jgi:catechol 2,3-dioxygenase-like lactoylglutathione lyase family enzyme